MGRMLWGPLPYGHWPTQQLPEEFRQLKHSDVETLILSGNMDFSTPPEYATKELLPYLRNGRQVILSECGHVGDVMYLNAENTRRILTSFYRAGVVDTSLNVYTPMNFNVSWGFPKMAKVAFGTLAFLGAAVVAGIVLLAR